MRGEEREGDAGAARPRVLTFDPAAHIYRVDGVVVPNATTLLEARGLTPDYSRIPWQRREHARARGIHVDACCDLYDEGDLDWSTVHPEAVPYVKAWARFRDVEGYRPLVSQPHLYHPRFGYAGTPDSVGMVRKVWAIVERKATYRMASSYRLQTAAYAMPGMWAAGSDGVLEPVGWPTPIRFGIQLKPDGDYNPVPYDDPEDLAAFLGVVALARWQALGRDTRNGRR